MTKEERKQVYAKLLSNLDYNEKYGIPECEIRRIMQKIGSIKERMTFNEKRIDNASYGHKVPGNSYDASLYLVKKFHGVMFQKMSNENIIHYYVAYLDEKGIVRVANPASDFNTPKGNEKDWRFDIPLENFRKKSRFQTEIGVAKKFIACCNSENDVLKINSNIIVHNYIVMNGKLPTRKQLIKSNIEPNTITLFPTDNDAKEDSKNIRTK